MTRLSEKEMLKWIVIFVIKKLQEFQILMAGRILLPDFGWSQK